MECPRCGSKNCRCITVGSSDNFSYEIECKDCGYGDED